MNTAFLIFPHQLFRDIDRLKTAQYVYLIEETLFFNQYKFHKQKLILHRASMQYYASFLQQQGCMINYVEAKDTLSDVRQLIPHLKAKGIQSIAYYDPCDHWLEKRMTTTCQALDLHLVQYPTPLFINSKAEIDSYFSGKQHYFQTDFYIQQRKKLNILVNEKGQPEGGKWSFDADNRKKYPKNNLPPVIHCPELSENYRKAIAYVTSHFSDNYGDAESWMIYPSTHEESDAWLTQFLEIRFHEFGIYEDAIVAHASILHHSVLTPILNIGLLTPLQVVNASLNYAKLHHVPLNSLEGFIRQIIGWREFVRGVYVHQGSKMRTTNFWKFERPIPPSFYTATTGISPIDHTLKKLLHTGYNHHIERLMVLGNFMLLCEFNPNAVYQWFMEMYIDAYDWVMVPNVYGMSQFADGGTMCTKPYISGSNYLLKMSDYKKEEWCDTWDALFWHFMDKQRGFFLQNPRMGMLINQWDKRAEEHKSTQINLAKSYLQNLDEES
jgi:deoxyribodipyrimidine photolyase-related protein